VFGKDCFSINLVSVPRDLRLEAPHTRKYNSCTIQRSSYDVHCCSPSGCYVGHGREGLFLKNSPS
jgi:hypothetical protein